MSPVRSRQIPHAQGGKRRRRRVDDVLAVPRARILSAGLRGAHALSSRRDIGPGIYQQERLQMHRGPRASHCRRRRVRVLRPWLLLHRKHKSGVRAMSRQHEHERAGGSLDDRLHVHPRARAGSAERPAVRAVRDRVLCPRRPEHRMHPLWIRHRDTAPGAGRGSRSVPVRRDTGSRSHRARAVTRDLLGLIQQIIAQFVGLDRLHEPFVVV